MGNERWDLIVQLFEQCLDMDANARQARLASEDPAVAEEVLRMLAADGVAAGELAGIVQLAYQQELDLPENVPQRLGPFALREEIGRGGMGSVWLGERVEGGFEQRVAIKFIKAGMDSREILRMFAQESRILSLLQHPHIARLLDGGATADGRPYLVMEFIAGQPILEWCRGRKREEILERFLQICAALQFAHANLVVHRDLKPANVLVDELGMVKLLDFGIAKILAAGAPGATRTQVMAFTPEFSSPEQQIGAATTIATDIYSLGALLREILPTPLPQDLAAIIRLATREEPSDRYATVENLAQDLRNYLSGVPVSARQGNLRYLAARFVSRHRWAVAAAVAFVILLAGSLFWSLYQSRQIARERDRAAVVSNFLTSLFAAADPEQNQGSRLTIQELLDNGLNRARLLDEADTRRSLLETIGTAYFHLGLFEKSIRVYEELAGEYEQQGVPGRARLALARGFLAEAKAALGQRQHADADGALAERFARDLGANESATLARTLQHRCVQLHQAALFERAAAICAEANEAGKRSTLEPAQRSGILTTWARVLQDLHQYDSAEGLLKEAMPLARAAGFNMNSAMAQALSTQASLLYRQEKFEPAEKVLREAIDFKRKLYPGGHLDLARSLNNLANIVSSQGRQNDAIPIFTEAQKYYRSSLGEQSSELATSLSNLAMSRSHLKQTAEAARLMETVMAMQAATAGPGRLPHINSQIKYASLLIEDMNQCQRARIILQSATQALQRLENPAPLQSSYAMSMLAYCLLEAGQITAAERMASEARRVADGVLPPGHPLFDYADSMRAGALVRQQRFAEARTFLAQIQAAKDSSPTQNWWERKARDYWAALPSRFK